MASIIGGLATSHAPQLSMPALRWSELPTRTKGPFHPKPGIAEKRTIDETWCHIGQLVPTINPTECANYFANAGYASVKT